MLYCFCKFDWLFPRLDAIKYFDEALFFFRQSSCYVCGCLSRLQLVLFLGRMQKRFILYKHSFSSGGIFSSIFVRSP